MIRSLALPLIALLHCLTSDAADEGYLRIRDGAPKAFIHYKLGTGEVVKPNQHFKEAKNIGHNDLLLMIKDADGAEATVRLVRKRNATIVIPPTKFNHTLLGVECLDLATYQDASSLLGQFASPKSEIVRLPSQTAEEAVLKAQTRAAAQFDEFKALRQQLDARNALAEVEALWGAIQTEALKVRSKLGITIEGDFPELHRAITSTESLSFPISNTSATAKDLQRLHKELAGLSAIANQPKEKRPDYVVNLEKDYPEVHALNSVVIKTVASDADDYLKSLQDLSAELQAVDRKYKAGETTSLKTDPDGYRKVQLALETRPDFKQLNALAKGTEKDVAISRSYVESINASSVTLTEEGFEDAQKPFLKQVAGVDKPLKALAVAIEKLATAHDAVKAASSGLNTTVDNASVKSLGTLTQADLAGNLTDRNREFDTAPALASIKEITGTVANLTKALAGANAAHVELEKAMEAVSSQSAQLQTSAKELQIRQSEVARLIKYLEKRPRLNTPNIDATIASLAAYSAALEVAGGTVRSNILAVVDHSRKASSGNTVSAEIKDRIKDASASARAVMQSLAGPRTAAKAVEAATGKFEMAVSQLRTTLLESAESPKYKANASRAAENLSGAARQFVSSSAEHQKADEKVTQSSSTLALNLGALNTALNSDLSKLPIDLLELLASVPQAMSKTIQVQNVIGQMTLVNNVAKLVDDAVASVSKRVDGVLEKSGLNIKEVDLAPVQKAVADALKQLESLSFAEWDALVKSISGAAEKVKSASDEAAASLSPLPLTTAEKAKAAAACARTLSDLLNQAAPAAKALNQKQAAVTAALQVLQKARSESGLGGDEMVFTSTGLDGWDQPASEALMLEKQWQNVAASNAQRMKQAGERAGELLADRLEKELEEGLSVMRRELGKVDECLKTAIASRDEIAKQYQVNYAVNVAMDGIHPEALIAHSEVSALLSLDDIALKRAKDVLKRGRTAIAWIKGATERAVNTFEIETSKLQAEMETARKCIWEHKTAATNKASELRSLISKTQAGFVPTGK
ncbi:MAG: hypothetical protein O3B01_11335 [Planctomycetota bacterium]|nr:hypothetical protein [Planctomycetota bacterium]